MRRTILLALISTACHAPVRAQPARARSELASVSQDVAGAHVDIVYRRPVARGRALFGVLVPWGKVWTPSADSAARITLSAPVTVNGAELPAGAYGLWAIPDSTGWTVIFSRVASAHHLAYPQGHDALRVRATPVYGEHVETLLLAFPVVDADSAVLQLRWGTTVVPIVLRAAVPAPGAGVSWLGGQRPRAEVVASATASSQPSVSGCQSSTAVRRMRRALSLTTDYYELTAGGSQLHSRVDPDAEASAAGDA